MKGLSSIGRALSGLFHRKQNITPAQHVVTVTHDPEKAKQKSPEELRDEAKAHFLRSRFNSSKHKGRQEGAVGGRKITFIGGRMVTRAEGYEKMLVRNTTPASRC